MSLDHRYIADSAEGQEKNAACVNIFVEYVTASMHVLHTIVYQQGLSSPVF